MPMIRNAASIVANTGEIVCADDGQLLASGPLGSCVAVLAFAAADRRGVLAHVMLPGAATAAAEHPLRYADNAVVEIARLLSGRVPRLALVGGANVLQRPDDFVAKQVVDAVRAALARRGWTVLAEAIGGSQRRMAWLDTGDGACWYTAGDGPPQLLLPGLPPAGKS